MKFIILRGLALFFLLMVSQSVFARGWMGAAACISGGHEIFTVSDTCDWNSFKSAYYAEKQPIEARPSESNVGDDKSFVPTSGNYEMKMYWCSFPYNMDTCNKTNGSVLLSGGIVRLESSKNLRSQQIVTSAKKTVAPNKGGYCITLSDVDTGYEYKGKMGYGPDGRGKFCADAYELPVNPPICTFNSGAVLDVKLGQMERSDIAVKSGTTTPVTKDITINCAGNIEYNANMKLEYTPISVSNDNVVSTSTKGLGVAVLYKGKVIQPGESFPLSYQPGINTLTLGFEAVRDPAMALSDLKTGDFTANAVLVFTEQ